MGRQQHPGNAQFLSEFAAVHWAGAAEGRQSKAAGVIAAFQGYGADGPLHIGVDHPDNAQGGIPSRSSDLFRQPGQQPRGPFLVQGQAAAEELGRAQAAQQQVGVGDRYAVALAVASGARVGAGRFRANDQRAAGVHPRNGAAASPDGVYFNHRDADGVAAEGGGGSFLDAAGAEGNIGRSAAHIQGDQVRVAGLHPGVKRADHAAGRAAEDSSHRLGSRQMRRNTASGGLHNPQAAA